MKDKWVRGRHGNHNQIVRHKPVSPECSHPGRGGCRDVVGYNRKKHIPTVCLSYEEVEDTVTNDSSLDLCVTAEPIVNANAKLIKLNTATTAAAYLRQET